ncbi:MAG: hypothetical protein HYS74_02570 [Parcubacteria group bacterium]|nr:hypothetical protein [Parcubacteria group bacterium]
MRKPKTKTTLLALCLASSFVHAAAVNFWYGPVLMMSDPLGAAAPAFWFVWWPALPHYARIFRYGRYVSVFFASAVLNAASIGALFWFGIVYALAAFSCSVGLLFLGFHMNEKRRARAQSPGQH